MMFHVPFPSFSSFLVPSCQRGKPRVASPGCCPSLGGRLLRAPSLGSHEATLVRAQETSLLAPPGRVGGCFTVSSVTEMGPTRDRHDGVSGTVLFFGGIETRGGRLAFSFLSRFWENGRREQDMFLFAWPYGEVHSGAQV